MMPLLSLMGHFDQLWCYDLYLLEENKLSNTSLFVYRENDWQTKNFYKA